MLFLNIRRVLSLNLNPIGTIPQKNVQISFPYWTAVKLSEAYLYFTNSYIINEHGKVNLKITLKIMQALAKSCTSTISLIDNSYSLTN